MKKIYSLLIILTSIILSACGGSSDPIEPTPSPIPDKDKISFASGTSSSLSFDADGGSATISFTASKGWTATLANNRADSWCQVEPASGQAGTGSITIKVAANVEPDDKSAVLQIKSGTAMASINVSQKQKDALTLSADKFEVDALGGNIEIEVKANVKYTYSISEEAQKWISYEGSRALTTSYLKFKVAVNDTDQNCEGTIILTDGTLSEVVTVYQKASGPTIVISKKEYTISSEGEMIQVEVSANVDVEVQMPDADWISENKSRAFSTHTYYFEVAANDTYDSRSAEIIFRNRDNNLEEKVIVNQLQRNAIVLAGNEYTLGKEATELDFEVMANVDFSVEVEGNWIKQAESRGLTSTTLHFDIAENTSESTREGKIIITCDGIVQEIKVKQVIQYTYYLAMDSEGISGYEMHLVNFENNSLSMFKLDEEGRIDRMDCLTETGDQPLSISFYENGLIESMACDSVTLVFSNYNDCYVDIAVVYGDSVQVQKEVQSDVTWSDMMYDYSRGGISRAWYDDVEQSELQQGLYNFLNSQVGKVIVAVEDMFEGLFYIKGKNDSIKWMFSAIKGIVDIGVDDSFVMNTIDVASVYAVMKNHPLLVLWNLIKNYASYVEWCTEFFYRQMLLFDAWNKENIETGLQNLNAEGIIGRWIVVDMDMDDPWGMMEEEMEPGDWIEFRANYTCSWRQAGEVVNSKYRIDGNVLTLYDIDNSWYIPYSYQIKELTATRMVLRLDGGIWFQGWVEMKREK